MGAASSRRGTSTGEKRLHRDFAGPARDRGDRVLEVALTTQSDLRERRTPAAKFVIPDMDLLTLGCSFARLRARWARQGRRVRQLSAEADKVATARNIGHLRGSKRQVAALELIREETGYHGAWGRWSSTADELADLVARILSQPARRVPELAVKFDALLWLLLGDGAVVDDEAALQVRRFGRELRRMAAPRYHRVDGNSPPGAFGCDKRDIERCSYPRPHH